MCSIGDRCLLVCELQITPSFDTTHLIKHSRERAVIDNRTGCANNDGGQMRHSTATGYPTRIIRLIARRAAKGDVECVGIFVRAHLAAWECVVGLGTARND